MAQCEIRGDLKSTELFIRKLSSQLQAKDSPSALKTELHFQGCAVMALQELSETELVAQFEDSERAHKFTPR